MENKNPDSSQKLFLFTTSFPFGQGETFLADELKVLKDHFSEIIILPLQKSLNQHSKLPSNVIVAELSVNNYKGSKVLVRNLFLFFRIFFLEFLAEKNKKGFFKRRKFLRSNLLQCIYYSEILDRYISENASGNEIFYSYWCHDWATILSIIKLKKKRFRFSVRMHGYDLYSERHDENIIPFRNFQLSNVAYVFTVSSDGTGYLQKKHQVYSDKFRLSHLGVFDNGTNPYNRNELFTLVSCSNCNFVKRVHLIAEALQHVKFPLRWVHFGNGPEWEKIKNKVALLPANIKAELKGRTDHSEIMEFYSSAPVHAFIHVSSSEGGVPVAIQEAMSFSIPVIAVSVGGVPDIVVPACGILINECDVSPSFIAKSIEEFQSSPLNSEPFRKNVKEQWKKGFSALQNYSLFCEQLKTL